MDDYPVRKHARAPGHDYRGGEGYFITLCTRHRRPFFGRGRRGAVALNGLGRLVEHGLAAIPAIYPHVRMDATVVMPEHVHFLLWMEALPMESESPSRLRWGRKSLGVVVNQFKGAISKSAAQEFGVLAGSLWQRGYFDRVVRVGAEESIRRYIERHRVAGARGGKG
jgi:REP element-mobilizing transposase RayT